MVAAPRVLFFFCRQKTAYDMRISDWSSDVCSSDLVQDPVVITSWKEIARIEARGELEITGRHGIAEPQHVDLARPSRNPPHSLVVDLDELTDRKRVV